MSCFVKSEGETSPRERRKHPALSSCLDNANFHFFVLEQCLSLHEPLKNKMLTVCLRGLNAGAMLTSGLSVGQWHPVRPACSSLTRCSQMAAVQPPSVPHRPFQLESSPAPSKTSSLIDRPRGYHRMEPSLQ